jgi:hypothetical protein
VVYNNVIQNNNEVKKLADRNKYFREYLGEWRKKNKDKIVKYNKQYWDKKHEEQKEQKEKEVV